MIVNQHPVLRFKTTSTFGYMFSTPNDTSPLLLVLDPTQLHVVLPFSASSCNTDSICSGLRNHGLQTRLQKGAITRENYASFSALLPELSSLQLMDTFYDTQVFDQYHAGFSFLVDITIADVEEPKTFKCASNKVEWQIAM